MRPSAPHEALNAGALCRADGGWPGRPEHPRGWFRGLRSRDTPKLFELTYIYYIYYMYIYIYIYIFIYIQYIYICISDLYICIYI